MSSAAFFHDATKRAVRAAIERVEKRTCAEVVVVVRRTAGLSYRDVDLACGAVVAFVVLLLLLFLPKTFSTSWMPVDVGLAFAGGAFACNQTSSLRRLLTSRARRRTATRYAASDTFQSMGVGRTSGRHGILVYVAIFEGEVAVVPDVGVNPRLLDEAEAALQASLEAASPDRFVTALEQMGLALADSLPRRPDDVNELSDEVGVS